MLPRALLALSLAATWSLAQPAPNPAPAAAVPAALSIRGNLVDSIERPLRYRPEGSDFVGVNGPEFFNRPLYGRTTAFRVDGGDRPEYVLYLPGRGGNLRLGLRTPAGTRWLHAAESVTVRYRPGTLLHEIADPLLGPAGRILLEAIALNATDGLVVRIEAKAIPAGVELVWAFGGVNGERGRRDGDIGTETVPISQWFQLQPAFCADNRFELAGDAFTVRSKAGTIRGQAPAGSRLAVADARHWAAPEALLGSRGQETDLPVVTGLTPLVADQPVFLGFQRVDADSAQAAELDTYRNVTAPRAGAANEPVVVSSGLAAAYAAGDWPRVFAEAQAHFAALRNRVVVDSPDAYLNAAVGALNVAADAVWDEPQGAVMHGAIAWRSRLLGWRGPYAMNALGWPDRMRRHLSYWATRQNTDPIPAVLPPPDEDSNLARSEAALHSNGDISNSHYDMNLVYIDAVFRHLLWTGDLELARTLWPVIERHLAWERRLFRREYGPAKLPLYEAYAAIWASDDLQYHGSGTTHASVYNHWHNQMAARLAELLGQDPAPYRQESALIARGLREQLWMEEAGEFAEYKDLLGRPRVHPSAALWTFYHTLDSAVPTPSEAVRMADGILRRLPRLPVKGPGVPEDEPYAVLATTDWMPYTWSLNNVVMGENVHTALGLWQAGRAEEAYRLTKSALLAAMYMGICPGNVGTMSYLDVYRRESQRDFADGSGVLSRALVEGLFGLRPDALAGELHVVPGLPAAWDRASIRHPAVSLAFTREGRADRYVIEPRFGRAMALRLEVAARGAAVAAEINGRPVESRWLEPVAGLDRRLEIRAPAAERLEIVLRWTGEAPAPSEARIAARLRAAALEPMDWSAPLPADRVVEPVDLSAGFNDRVTALFAKGKYRSPRSPYVSLAMPAQGIGAWAGHVNAMATLDDRGLRATAVAGGGRIVLPNGVPLATPGPGESPNIIFTSQWDNYPREVTLPLGGRAHRVYLLMAGSTNAMQSRIDNGEVVVTYADGGSSRLPLHNPTTWWPVEQDYLVDDFQFRHDGPLPPRVDLATGRVRILDAATFKGQGAAVRGGAATVLHLRLDPTRDLREITVRALSNEVVIGLMAATLER